MSNVRVGGVEAELVLNMRQWSGQHREALKDLRDMSSAVNRGMSDFSRATTSGFSAGGRAARGFAQDVGRGTDEVSTRLRDARGRFVSFGSDVRTALGSTAPALQRFRGDWNGTLINIRETMRDVRGVVNGWAQSMRTALTSAGSNFISLQQEMRNVNAIAKLSEAELTRVSDSVKGMTGEMQLTQGPRALAAALKEISGAGFDARDGLKVLRSAAKGADAGETDTKTFAAGLTPVLRSYGLDADSSGLVTDQMFRAMDQGKLSAEELARGIGQVVPVAGQAGVSLQELMGSLASMSLNGKSAAENFTAYRSAMLKILAPAEDARKLLRAYGVEAGETAIRTKGLVGVIKDLYAKTGGNQVALKRILDDEGLQAAAALMKLDQGATTERMIQGQFSADGATEAAFRERAKGLQFQLQQVSAAWEAFKIGAMSGLEPVLAKGAAALQRVSEVLLRLPDSTKAAIGGVAAVATVVTTLSAGALLVAPSLIQVGTWVASFGGVAKMGAAAAGVFSGALSGIAGVVSTVAAPLAAIVGTTALVATAWRNDWGGIRDYTATVMSDLGDMSRQAMSAIGSVVGPTVRELAESFRAALPVAQEFVTWLAQGFFEQLIPALRQTWQVWGTGWDIATSQVRVAWGAIGPVLGLLKDGLIAVGDVVWKALSGEWRAAWDSAVATVRNIGPRIRVALAEIQVNVLDGLAELGNKVRQALLQALSPYQLQDDNGWKPVIDGPVDRSVEFLKNKLDQAANYSQQKLGQVVGNLAGMAGAAKGPTSSVQIGGGLAGYTAAPDLPDVTRGRARARTQSPEQLAAQRVVANARQWDGVSFRPGDVEQCANFVRAVYGAAGVKVGVSSRPVDLAAMRPGDKQGPGFANSLFGKDVGKIISSLNELRPGDAVGFRNTYGEFKPGAITHVGVYVGDGKFTHRPTANAPVRTDSLDGYWGSKFAAGMRPFALSKGGQGMGSAGLGLQDVLKTYQQLETILGRTNNAYETQRREIRRTFAEATASAKSIGAGEDVFKKLAAEQRRQIAEVNEAERRESARTSNEVAVARLEAEGKMGEAARLRIAATAEQERQRLQDILKTYPQLRAEVERTIEAVTAAEQRQLVAQQVEVAVGQAGDRRAVGDFRAQDPGMQSLMAQFPEFRAQIEAAYQALQAYIADPAESARAGFQQALGLVQQLAGLAQEQQQQKLEQIEFERQLGQITNEESLARQGELLNGWIGGEEQKRAMMLQMIDAYRQHFEQQLELQGEFNLETLEQFQESLLALGELTNAQRAQLAATSQLLQQQRVAEQQQWQQMMQQQLGAFQNFLGNVMLGNQTFKQAFTQLWKSIAQQIIAELAKMIIKALALKAILKSIGGFFGFHGGGWVDDSHVPQVHTGGWIGRGSVALPSFHSGGWVGSRLRSDETLAKLQTGEFVLSRQHVAGLAQVEQSPGPAVPSVQVRIDSVVINREADVEALGVHLGRTIRRQLAGGV